MHGENFWRRIASIWQQHLPYKIWRKKQHTKWGKNLGKNGEKNLEKNYEKNVEKKMQDGDIGKCRKNFGNETQKKFWG